jgi:lysophospholipase L1-like esterase
VAALKLKQILFALAPAALLLLAVEIVLRVTTFPPRPTFDAPEFTHASIRENPLLIADGDLVWKARPGYRDKYITLNEQGFRGPLPAEPKTKRRVVFFGDSVTFGWGLSTTDYVDRLRACAAEADVEFLNFSVPGYTSTQGRLLMEKTIARLQPDFVVATHLWNDSYYALPRWDPPVGPQRWLRTLYALGYAKFRYQQWRIGPQPKGSFATPPSDYQANLFAMNRLATDAGARFLLLLHTWDPEPLLHFGAFPRSVEPERYAAFAALMREFAARRTIPLLDLNRDLAAPIRGHAPLFIFDGYHLSELGHEAVAFLLADFLQQNGLDADLSCAAHASPARTLLDLARRSEEIDAEVAAFYYWRLLNLAPDHAEAAAALARLRPDLLPTGDAPS